MSKYPGKKPILVMALTIRMMNKIREKEFQEKSPKFNEK
jgi:hypothetical protein